MSPFHVPFRGQENQLGDILDRKEAVQLCQIDNGDRLSDISVEIREQQVTEVAGVVGLAVALKQDAPAVPLAFLNEKVQILT